MRSFAVAVGLGVVVVSHPAFAAPPQVLPLSFDPSIAADPTSTSNEIAQAEMGLSPLPLDELTTLKTSGVTLWFWPENAAALTRAGASGPGMMSWPAGSATCAKHDAFTLPATLATNESATCKSAESQVRAALDLGACEDIDQPELYVLGYKPASPDANVTASIEGLVGLAGEALSHTSVPAGLLPSDFVANLRRILLVLRHDSLAARATQSHAGYTQALSVISANASCFDASLATQLGALQTELDGASALLEKTKTDGEAAHQHDEVCLAAHSRTRAALPFGLSDDDRRFIAFWLGGTYWRMRGGGLMPLGSTQAARWDFLEQPFTRIGELTGGKDGSDAAFDIYLAVFEGWSDWMDMGETQPGGDKYYDLVGMTARGSRQVASASQTLASRGYDVTDLGAGGLGMGPCYFWGHEQLKSFRYADQMSPPYGAFIEGFTAVGEWCSGATIALGFAKTLLRGTATGKPPTVDLCAGRTCGDDTCGGSCGTCGEGLSCVEGKCAGAAAPQSTSPAPTSTSSPPSIAQPVQTADAPSSSSGCACRAAPSDTRIAPVLLPALALLALRRRRR